MEPVKLFITIGILTVLSLFLILLIAILCYKLEKRWRGKMANDYYDVGGISTIDVIRAKLTEEQYKGFLLGNIIKYSTRLNWKGEPLKNSDKLNMYGMWLHELLESSPESPNNQNEFAEWVRRKCAETPMNVDTQNAEGRNPCDNCDHKHQAATLPPCKDCLYRGWKHETNPHDGVNVENSWYDTAPCGTCKYILTSTHEEPCCACGTANNFARYESIKAKPGNAKPCPACKWSGPKSWPGPDPCLECSSLNNYKYYEPKERDE